MEWRDVECICFDVDSTVCTDEAIDELAAFCGKAEAIKQLTLQAMEGGMTFQEAFRSRLNILQPSQRTLNEFIHCHPPRLTEGIQELVKRLHLKGVAVYLVSGGILDILKPVADVLNIPEENIFGNRLFFNENGEYCGFDETAFTSCSGGKARVVEHLRSRFHYKRIVFVGDGITDLEAWPPADTFLGFGGNAERPAVKAKAPFYFHSIREMQLFLLDKGLLSEINDCRL